MKGWFNVFPFVIITTFINSAASKINIKINQQFHRFSLFIFHLLFILIKAHRNFFLYIENSAASTDIYSTVNIYSSVYPNTLSVLTKHSSKQRNSSRTSSKHIASTKGNIWKAPAFRRNFMDAM